MGKALNYFDLRRGHDDLTAAFAKAKARFLVLCFSTDWLYPSYMSRELIQAMLNAGLEASYSEIETPLGHDAFLLEFEKMRTLIKAFL